MRKYIFTSFILLVLLVACKAPIDFSSHKEPVVRPASLDEEDLTLLDGVGLDEVFVFDLDLNDTKANRIDTWIEYYEFGEKKENIAGIGTGISLDDSKIKIVFSRSMVQPIDEKREYEKFVVSHLKDSGVGTGENVVEKEKSLNNRLTDSIEKEMKLELGVPRTLAVMIERNSGGIMIPDFANNSKSFLEEIKQYDRVYLLRVKLSDDRGQNDH